LKGYVLCDQLSLNLGFLDLLDIQQDLFPCQLRQLLLDLFNLLTLTSNDNARTGCINLNTNSVGSALDENARRPASVFPSVFDG
jgi:hypothetical protein